MRAGQATIIAGLDNPQLEELFGDAVTELREDLELVVGASEAFNSMTRNGRVRFELKTPWFNGTTHVIFEPLDFMYRMYGMPWAQGWAGTAISRLVALIPKPKVNLTRFHGVFA